RAMAGTTATAAVLFVKPLGAGEGWESGDLRRHAERIPRVRTALDEAGAEARLFGARTSGQVLLYDAGGDLRFSGGITGARGQQGANAGRNAVRDLLSGHGAARSETPVFGCALL